MRLFVAVDIDDATRAQLAEARQAMEAVLNRARVPPRVSWVNPEAAHVTLRFIGETSEEHSERIAQALASRFRMRRFDVRWEHLGTFPSAASDRGERTVRRPPQVIWIGPEGDAADLGRLAEAVNQRLDAIVGPGERRPFKPHITIGRVKEPGNGVDWAQALAARRWEATTTSVDHVTLYRSRTTPAGAVYTSLGKGPL